MLLNSDQSQAAPVEFERWKGVIDKLHVLGINHLRLTYRFQGRDFRLTDVHGEVVKPVLA